MTTQTRAPRSLAAALLCLLAGATAAAQDDQTGAADGPQTPLPPVRLVTVQAPDTEITRTFYGRVISRQTVDLAFQVGGQIAEFPVLNGEEVARGTLLARLDLDPFERAVRRAEVNLDQARREFERATQLALANAASAVRAEDAGTARDLARLQLEEAREALDDATLTASFDGIVARRLVATYTTVSAGTPVLRLHDMSAPRVRIDVPERLFRRAGDLTQISFTADLGTGFTGVALELAEYAAETTGVSQTYAVDLALPDVPGYQPLPGRTAIVTVALKLPGGDTFSLPATALLPAERGGGDGAGAQVMVFAPDAENAEAGSVRTVPVRVVSREGADVAVATGDALEPGMEVVSTGGHLLTAGDRVRRFTGFAQDS